MGGVERARAGGPHLTLHVSYCMNLLQGLPGNTPLV